MSGDGSTTPGKRPSLSGRLSGKLSGKLSGRLSSGRKSRQEAPESLPTTSVPAAATGTQVGSSGETPKIAHVAAGAVIFMNSLTDIILCIAFFVNGDTVWFAASSLFIGVATVFCIITGVLGASASNVSKSPIVWVLISLFQLTGVADALEKMRGEDSEDVALNQHTKTFFISGACRCQHACAACRCRALRCMV